MTDTQIYLTGIKYSTICTFLFFSAYLLIYCSVITIKKCYVAIKESKNPDWSKYEYRSRN